MKQITTILCSLVFCIAGICLAVSEHDAKVSKHQTLSAATLPVYNTKAMSSIPLDIQLDLAKKYSRTDTVYVPQEYVVINGKSVKNKTKRAHTLAKATQHRQGISPPASNPDSVVGKYVCGGREEYPPDSIELSKSSICLTVDGEVVYKR